MGARVQFQALQEPETAAQRKGRTGSPAAPSAKPCPASAPESKGSGCVCSCSAEVRCVPSGDAAAAPPMDGSGVPWCCAGGGGGGRHIGFPLKSWLRWGSRSRSESHCLSSSASLQREGELSAPEWRCQMTWVFGSPSDRGSLS